MPDWRAVLGTAIVCGGDCDDAVACLTLPPDGVGVPGLRTEDQVYPQRDGVGHFADWYDPRIITLLATIGAGCGCSGIDVARHSAAQLMEEWSRECDETELVLFTGCPPANNVDDRAFTGPYGVRGRPRVAQLNWLRSRKAMAEATLRFDSVDHRLYILDEDGTPGSGAQESEPPLNEFDLSIITDGVISGGIPLPVMMYRLNELDDGPFRSLAGNNPQPDFDPAKAIRGFPQAHYAGMADGLNGSIGASTYFPAIFTGGTTPNRFFEGIANSDSSFTFATWFRSDQGPGVEADIAQFNSNAYRLTTFRYRDNGTNYFFSSPTRDVLEDGNWHHVAITTNSGSPTLLYVDGVLAETTAFTGVVGGAVTRAYIAPGRGFYSEMALWSSVLSASQIRNVAQVLVTEPADVAGTLCVPMRITFEAGSGVAAGLIGPSIVLDDGSYVGVDATIPPGQTVEIDTDTGKASVVIAGVSYPSTIPVSGDPFLTINSGANYIGFRTQSGNGASGTASVSWRPAVISA